MTVVAPASRNAPCPCGSGRRYKDCHGALGAAAAAVVAPPAQTGGRPAELPALLQAALEHQQAGDLVAAMRGYERALAVAPDDFDALHMLGVVHYQRHDFDRGEALLRAAIARNPNVASAQQNLALLLEARRLEAAEDALCREVLPRLAHLCAPASAFEALVAAKRGVDLLDGTAGDGGAADLTTAIAEGAYGKVQRHQPVAAAVPGQPVTPPQGALEAPVVVLVGVAIPLAAFPTIAPHAQRVLVVDRDAPSALHDRLRELSDDARHSVHVRYATLALEASIGLPGGALHRVPPHAS